MCVCVCVCVCIYIYLTAVYSISSIHIKKPRTASTRRYHHCIDSIKD